MVHLEPDAAEDFKHDVGCLVYPPMDWSCTGFLAELCHPGDGGSPVVIVI